jgi:hypothetical protein
MISPRAMSIEDGTAEFAHRRVAELRRAIVAGEYAPDPDRVAGQILATLGLIRKARRRFEALGGPRFEPEGLPPTRRFRARAEPARSPR